ncbi:MAG: discoidin domain-containing protein, partial [Firmicutes bacterium]|nr:discoidin domain-containing protein [Bacillota bacterium]
MKQSIRMLALLTLFALVLPSIFACAESGGDEESTALTVGTTTGEVETTMAAAASVTSAETTAYTVNGDVEYTQITVTEDMITSSTPWNNGSDVAANAFDGDTSTYFDGVEEGWIKIDLGAEYLIGKIGYAPRSGYESRLTGTFYGSLDGRTWYEIYTVKSVSKLKTVDYTSFTTVAFFRYIKYENLNDCANISEIEIYSAINIPESYIATIERDTYEDGTYENLSDYAEDRGMTEITTASCDYSALFDNNPSTAAVSETGEFVVDLGGTYLLGDIEYMPGATDGASLSDVVGGEFYGSADGESWDLLYTVSEATDTVSTTQLFYGTIYTTGEYRYVKYVNSGVCSLSELRLYSMDVSMNISLAAQAFALETDSDVNCVALNWASDMEADGYELYRAAEGCIYQLVYSGSGASWHDYELPLGNYTYMIRVRYGDTLVGMETSDVTCYELPSDVKLYKLNNQKGSTLRSQSSICSDGVYYSYSVNVSNNAVTVTESTSEDGYTFSNTRTIIDSSADSSLSYCKIESVKTAYIESANAVIIAAHWELPSGYADGKLFLVTGTPGGEFTCQGVFNPKNIEVRDLSIFVDDDDTAYLLAAANPAGGSANETLYIFQFTDDYTGIKKVVTTLFEYQYREMPNMVKLDGWYYLFTSAAAGWYPSNGQYASSQSIESGWSDLRDIGNTSTFSSQSSWIAVLGSGDSASYLMYAYRWIAGTGTSGTMIAPISFDNGYAYYDYYPTILYNSETGDMIPVSGGRILSQDAEITASLSSADGYGAELAVDGDYFTSYTASEAFKWPVTMTIDLGAECELTYIQISWYICKGSEGYYTYYVEGSLDGE